MAIYRLSIKIISRSKGASAVGKAAHRAGEKIKNERNVFVNKYAVQRIMRDNYIVNDCIKIFVERYEFPSVSLEYIAFFYDNTHSSNVELYFTFGVSIFYKQSHKHNHSVNSDQ